MFAIGKLHASSCRKHSAHRRSYQSRKGAVVALCAIFLPIALILVAVVVELSRLRFVKNQLQATADAGALSGAARLRLTSGELETTHYSLEGEGVELVRPSVQQVVAANYVAHLGPNPKSNFVVQANETNSSTGDIVVGIYSSASGFVASTIGVNAVRVNARFETGHPNGSLSFLFRNFLPSDSTEMRVVATARVERPTLLPFLVFQPQWDWLMAGNGIDFFSVNSENNYVQVGSDGILETTVFPNDWDGLNMPPGNFGWFDLGPNSDTTTLMRQIDAGPNETDMAYFGGSLSAGDFVSGTTGLRAATEVAFMGGDGYEGIIGKPRLIAIYDYATGQGTKAQFRITKFVLARIVFADLSGTGMGIIIQPITREQDPNKVQLVE